LHDSPDAITDVKVQWFQWCSLPRFVQASYRRCRREGTWGMHSLWHSPDAVFQNRKFADAFAPIPALDPQPCPHSRPDAETVAARFNPRHGCSGLRGPLPL